MGYKDEVTRIYRGLRRRVNRGKPLDSYPYLTGDSYFYSCQFYFESEKLHRVPSRQPRQQKDKSLFVKISDLESFIVFLEENSGEDYSDFALVLHNGDNTISKNFLDLLAIRFRKIFAVNLFEDAQSFSPIPIGLENCNYFTNGVPADFNKLIKSGLKAVEDRTTLLLESFSLQTNLEERETCTSIAAQLGRTQLQQASPLEYRTALTESKFVLSPAGNGFDCHRTWEAMYLGAIPILRRAHWPFININLPVLLVDEWEDLLKIDLNLASVPLNPSWSEDFWNGFFND